MTESLFNEFKRRVDQALGNKPVLDSLVIDQQKASPEHHFELSNLLPISDDPNDQ